MMKAKALIRGHIERGVDLGAAMEAVNLGLCDGNDEGMFVTVWAGVLDYATGHVEYVNAGHNPPMLRQRGSWSWLRESSGMALGLFDDEPYETLSFDCEPGDLILLYTDGVTEAADSAGGLFGTERMLRALNLDPDASPEALLHTVKSEIDAFVGTASQFDDITMLCLRYVGDTMKKITVDATTENLQQVLSFVDAELEAADCPMKTQMQIDVAVEELFVNIANYAYAPGSGTAVIGVDVQDGVAKITFADSGIPYDPLKKEDPDVQLPAEEREIGGLGILIVKKTMDDLFYEYRDGQNLLTICKKL
jgi:sigma-B regulation protein RsbU (phosphoserine phosphatase)